MPLLQPTGPGAGARTSAAPWRAAGLRPQTSAPADVVGAPPERGRRSLAAAIAAVVVSGAAARRAARAEVSEKAQKLSQEDKQRIDELYRGAVDAPTVEEEEAFWTKLMDGYGDVPEVLIRAACNRGNSRLRQGKFELALADYNRAIAIGPYEVDPFLNRGIAYEATGRLEEALQDYNRVLALNSGDPAGWNNRGNALLGMRRFKEASDAFKSALSISGPQTYPNAAINLNLAEYELGNDEAVLRDLRSILARFADDVPDARAAYALMMWERGDRLVGEQEWDRATANDPRYRQLDWVQKYRRWPPRLTAVLQRFSESTKVKVK